MDIIANNITSNKLEAANVTINSKDVYTWFSEKISSVTDLTATVKNLEKDLETAQTKLENVTNKVTNIESSVATVETSVSKNTTGIEAANTSIADVSSKVTTNTESISDLNTSLEGLSTKVNTNVQSISDLNTSLEVLSTKVDTNVQGISDLNTSLTTVSSKVTEHTESISDLSTGLQETNGKITANEGEISAIKTNIADINTNITNISTDLINVSTYCTNLQEKISAVNDELDGQYIYLDPVKTYQNSAECIPSADADGWFIAFKPTYLGIEPGGYISKLYLRSRVQPSTAKSNVSFRLDWWTAPTSSTQGTIDTSTTTLNITANNTVYEFDFAGKAPILSADDYIYRLVPVINGKVGGPNGKIGVAQQQGDSLQLTIGADNYEAAKNSGFVPAISVEFYNPVKQDDTSLQLFKRFFKKLQ